MLLRSIRLGLLLILQPALTRDDLSTAPPALPRLPRLRRHPRIIFLLVGLAHECILSLERRTSKQPPCRPTKPKDHNRRDLHVSRLHVSFIPNIPAKSEIRRIT